MKRSVMRGFVKLLRVSRARALRRVHGFVLLGKDASPRPLGVDAANDLFVNFSRRLRLFTYNAHGKLAVRRRSVK